MKSITSMFKKFSLLVLFLALGLAALPVVPAAAAGIQTDKEPPSYERLEAGWERLQEAYARQGERLDKADDMVARIQGLIDQATARGYDVSAVQAALDAFNAALPAAAAVHERGAAIIASHEGFNPGGKVTDPTLALETIRSLAQVLKDTHAAMDNTGQALRAAIQAFREAHAPEMGAIPSVP